MEIKIAYFVTVLLYAAVFSQSFIRESLNVVYYATLLSSVLLVAFTVTNPNGILFFCAVGSLVALVAAIVLTLRSDETPHKKMNNWSPTIHPDNRNVYHSKWTVNFRLRQILNLAGFTALISGFVFGQ